MQIPEINLHFK